MAEWHEDEWANVVTGVGVVGRDKRLSASWCGSRMDAAYAMELWRGSFAAGRIVEAPIAEMFRPGWDFKVSNSDEEYTPGEDPEAEKPGVRTDSSYARWKKKNRPNSSRRDAFPPAGGAAPPPGMPVAPPAGPKKPQPVMEQDAGAQAAVEGLKAYLEDLDYAFALKKAKQFARGAGGGAVLVGVEDGKKWDQPVNEAKIKGVRFLTPVAKGQIVAETYYNDPRAKNYGRVETYRVNASSLTGGPKSKATDTSGFIVHETRVLHFDGTVIDEAHRSREYGFGDPVFVRVEPVLRDHEVSWSGVGVILSGFATGQYKMKGLAQMLANKRGDLVKDRLVAMDYAAGTVKARVLDTEDDFEVKQVPVTGLPELIDRFLVRLAMAANMPVMLFAGDLPGGLNANGDTGLKMWWQVAKAEWCETVKPAIERLARYVFLAADGPTASGEPPNWCVELRDFAHASDAETATTRLTVAQADKIYFDMGGASAEEIIGSRWGGTGYSMDLHLDHEARDQAQLDQEAEDEARAKMQEAAAKAAADAPSPAPGAPAAPPKPTTPKE